MPVDETSNFFEDFSGGLNTLVAANRLNPNESPTHQNIWFDDGAIAKRLGQSRTSTTNAIYGRSWFGYSLHSGVISSSEKLIIYASIGLTRNLLLWTSDGININVITTVAPGTVTTAVASAVVTGSGTNWSSGGTAAVNAMIQVGNTIGIIQSVDSDTQLTLTANFGALNSGSAYTIFNSWASAKLTASVEMNKKIWTYGVGATPSAWDGTTQTFISAAPQANYAVVFKNYVFTLNTSANNSRVQWCALKDPTTWPASNFIDVVPDDGFPGVGMFLDGQSIVILKTNKAYKLSGDTFDPSNITYQLSPIFTPNDFIINSAKTVQLWNGVFMMLGLKGMYAYDGSGSIYKLVNYDKIRSEFATINIQGWAANPSPQTEPVAIIVDGNYWLQVPESLDTDKTFTYVFDKTGAVWRWNQAENGAISDFAYLNGTLYGINSDAGGTPGLMQLNTGNSDAQSTAINGTFTTKEIQFKETQRFGTCYVYYKMQSSGNLTFEYAVDGGAFTAVTIDMTVGSITRSKSQPIIIGNNGNTIQFRVSNNVAGQTFEVYGIEFFTKGFIR